jgi:hypothetical protein
MTPVARLLAQHHAGMLTTSQLIDGLRREGVANPEGLANDRSLPDPSSCGFEQRAAVHIERSPLLGGWVR